MLQGVIFLFSLGPEVFMDWLTMHLLLLCAAFFPPKHFSELWGEMPTGGSLVSCVAFDSAIPLLQFLLSLVYLHWRPQYISALNLVQMLMVWKKKFCLQQIKNAEQKWYWKNKSQQNRTKLVQEVEKKMLSSENVPYTWLQELLDLRACWILDNADPGYCRGAQGSPDGASIHLPEITGSVEHSSLSPPWATCICVHLLGHTFGLSEKIDPFSENSPSSLQNLCPHPYSSPGSVLSPST